MNRTLGGLSIDYSCVTVSINLFFLSYFQAPSSHPRPDDSERAAGDASSLSVWLVTGVIVSTLFVALIMVGFVISRRSNSR